MLLEVPQTPKDCRLPHTRWYGQQREALEFIANHRERVLFLDAPTATGKTALIQGIQYMMDTPVYAALWSRRLQHQCQQEIDCGIIMGRSNFQCNVEVGETCEFDWCGDNPGTRGDCPYNIQFDDGLSSPIAVLNYALLFTHLGKKRFPNRNVLICDEGHTLEDAYGNHLDVQLDRIYMEEHGFPVLLPSNCSGESGERDLIDWAKRVLDKMDYEPADRRQSARWAKICGQAERVLDTTEGAAQWRVYDTGYSVYVRLLWPLQRFYQVLGHFEQTIIMSATLGDMDAMAYSMGLGRDEYATLALPSAIPVERRLIYIWPVTSLKKDAGGLDYRHMTHAIIELASKYFQNDKGLIHVSSYKMARRLGRELAGGLPNRIIIEDAPGAASAAREQWSQRLDPAILCTPAAALGMDLPYLFPWQIIAKVPYPYLGDPIVKARSSIDPNWYPRKAAMGTVQMAGRVTRTPTDDGITIIADSSFEKNVYRRVRKSFPAWFDEALRWKEGLSEQMGGDV